MQIARRSEGAVFVDGGVPEFLDVQNPVCSRNVGRARQLSLFARSRNFCSSPVSKLAPYRKLKWAFRVLELIPQQQIENALMAYVQHGAV